MTLPAMLRDRAYWRDVSANVVGFLLAAALVVLLERAAGRRLGWAH